MIESINNKKMKSITNYAMKGTLVLFILLFFSRVYAQDSNLIYNGNFERNWTGSQNSELPEGWGGNRVPASNMDSENCPESSDTGTKSLRLNMTGGSLALTHGNESWRVAVIPVEAGATYVLKFWAKTSVDANVKVTMHGYESPNDDEIFKERILDDESFSFTSNKWEKVEKEVSIPKGKNINKSTLSFTIPFKNNGNATILLDDISLIRKKGSTEPEVIKPEVPRNLVLESHQREVEVSWQAIDDAKATYRVKIDKNTYEVGNSTSYTIKELTPNTNYTIDVVAIKNGIESETLSKNVQTESISPQGIPYLYKIHEDGIHVGTTLNLFYNDLENTNAVITYKIDGLEVKPDNGVLEFPAFESESKHFKLEIHINEGRQKEWDIVYPKLIIRKNN